MKTLENFLKKHQACQDGFAFSAASANVFKEQNQKLTADICRKYLPLKIWNQNEINL